MTIHKPHLSGTTSITFQAGCASLYGGTYFGKDRKKQCSLRTSGGQITFTLIPDIAVDVEAKTSGGRISTDFAVESTIQGKVPQNRLEGSINGGGPLLKLRTSGGNIHLQKATD